MGQKGFFRYREFILGKKHQVTGKKNGRDTPCRNDELASAACYSSAIASTGQTDAQAPQLMHFSDATALLSFTSLIAPFGHSPSHAPQLMQVSEFTL